MAIPKGPLQIKDVQDRFPIIQNQSCSISLDCPIHVILLANVDFLYMPGSVHFCDGLYDMLSTTLYVKGIFAIGTLIYLSKILTTSRQKVISLCWNAFNEKRHRLIKGAIGWFTLVLSIAFLNSSFMPINAILWDAGVTLSLALFRLNQYEIGERVFAAVPNTGNYKGDVSVSELFCRRIDNEILTRTVVSVYGSESRQLAYLYLIIGGNEKDSGIDLRDSGKILRANQKFCSALEYFRKSEILYEENRDRYLSFESLCQKTNLQAKLGYRQAAIQSLGKALSTALNLQDSAKLEGPLSYLAIAAFDLNEKDTTKKLFLRAHYLPKKPADTQRCPYYAMILEMSAVFLFSLRGIPCCAMYFLRLARRKLLCAYYLSSSPSNAVLNLQSLVTLELVSGNLHSANHLSLELLRISELNLAR